MPRNSNTKWRSLAELAATLPSVRGIYASSFSVIAALDATADDLVLRAMKLEVRRLEAEREITIDFRASGAVDECPYGYDVIYERRELTGRTPARRALPGKGRVA